MSTDVPNVSYTWVYPKVSGLAAWSENYKWYTQLSATRCSCIAIL